MEVCREVTKEKRALLRGKDSGFQKAIARQINETLACKRDVWEKGRCDVNPDSNPLFIYGELREPFTFGGVAACVANGRGWM